MLKFYEKDRPSCLELNRIMLNMPEYAQYESENQFQISNAQQDGGGLQVQSRPN